MFDPLAEERPGISMQDIAEKYILWVTILSLTMRVIFIRLAIVAFQNREITCNSDIIRT